MSTLVFGCASKQQSATSVDMIEPKEHVSVFGSNPNAMIPKAVIYKTNGDYNDNVFINMTDGRIISYPAPTDVSSYSTPIELGSGWLLDRRGGVGVNSVFLNYTYDQYSRLKTVPSQSQLLEHIIPGASVTRVVTLPITVKQALADPEAVKQYIPKD